MNKLIYIIIVFLVFSCKKKEDPTIIIGSPVFTFSGVIDDENINFFAGEEDVYMYSNFEKDKEGVFNFIGDFGNLNGNSKLKIGFRDYKARSQNEEVDILNVIKVGEGNYKDSLVYEKSFYKAKFKNNSYAGSSYQWNFSNGSIVNTQNPSDITCVFDNLGDVSVKLTARRDSFCSSEINQIIDLDSDCKFDVNTSFIPDSISGGTLSWNVFNSEGTGPYSSNVLINGTTGDSDSMHHFTTNQIALMDITQIDANGCEYMLSQNIDVYQTPSICLANFEYLGYQEIISLNKTYFNTIFVEWTDENGVIYSTKYKDQNENFINIISVEEYDLNEKGEKTLKIDLEFSCDLYGQNGNIIRLENGLATIAIAYPN